MVWAIVPAAGVGARYGAALPKQYLRVDGEMLIGHALRALLTHPQLKAAMVALAPDDAHWPAWTHLAEKPIATCVGADTRAGSVLAALHALPESVRADDFVLVHDAVRPNLRYEDLDRLLERGRADPVGAILAAPVRDTLKRAGDDGGIDGTQPRERLWRAFTPQLFRRLQLQRALESAQAAGLAVTDEAMAMEAQGARPLLVEGAEDNIKITTPADLADYQWLLRQREPAEQA